ncbi:phosphoribosylamine--glycine ligase [Thermosynechococcaceae cyanobacterium BACA0444]|uniref:Phosphoribosylamine--glycine ligase n=1 Tax=Pseudocalidococcus azoricus BACA0444 TaxID=2918990 RepID=A0AAE4FTH9_9CYAN|nr:phosphoribosylamine--glycine ligase [Pseudocalidococcus azoricus]MDS3861277.1 phosphoribosylamine--glycine ligase [Pseudocalidococcus azoricus BACA0444]
MKIIVVGSGGREHALAWALLKSATVTQIYCCPGNGGTARLERCQNIPIQATDLIDITQLAVDEQVGLVVVGPEVPLALGLVDRLQAAGIPAFGPTQAGAEIEASKAWAKALMSEANIPTAQAAIFTTETEAIHYVREQKAPIVVKADGLAAGKGVTVANSITEAIEAIEAAFGGEFGTAGQRVVIEECLQGQEISVLALTDRHVIRSLLPAQDHKRIGEGDTGPNTGGMGAYAPVPWVSGELMAKIQTQILEPALKTLQARGIDYRGVLYAGLMITPAGDPYVIEFNCRFGDPETQVVLPLLKTPLLDLLLACVNGTLAELGELAWADQMATGVVMAAGGYPGHFTKGDEITGIEAANSQAFVFQAGTRAANGQLFTDGGRVLTVVGRGETVEAALAQTYAGVAQVQFHNAYFRRDIGHRLTATSENLP